MGLNYKGYNEKFFFFKGRVALYAILKAIGIKENDEVLLPGFTCVVVPNAIVYLGAKPVYVDINPRTYNIDTTRIEEKITEKTKVIIAQHTFGIPAEMDKIMDIAKKYNLYVIEDSCHSIGSKYKGKEVGTFGDATFFSSQWSKPITTGLGGWAIVNNPKLKEKMEKIYSELEKPSLKEVLIIRLQYFLHEKFLTPSVFWLAQSIYRKFYEGGLITGSSSPEEFVGRIPKGYLKRMSVWQENLLKEKFKKIDFVIKHRKWIASLYEEKLRSIGVEPLSLPKDYEVVFLRYPLLIRNKRETLRLAQKEKIELGDWFVSPVHPILNDWEKVGYQKGECPVAENICDKVINLPTHPKINEKEVERIIKFLQKRI